MPVDLSNTRRQLDLYHDRFLPTGIGLFEDGAPDAAADEYGFMMRVNRLVFLRTIQVGSHKPREIVTAISSSGRLGLHAELIVFGAWLLRNGMPGAKKRPGRAPDLRRLFKAACAAFAALSSSNGSPKTTRIATKDIVKFWRICFDETTAPADHSSALRSLRKILPEYLVHLQAGGLEFNGLRVDASPRLARLAKALKTPIPTGTPKIATVSAPGVALPAGVTTPAVSSVAPVVSPTAFEIRLCYSSPDAEAEYRYTAIPARTVPHLSYSILPVPATSAEHKLRTDRVGKVMFKPEHDFSKTIRIEAVIDRIALVLSTKSLTSATVIWNALTKQVGNGAYVADRTMKAGTDDWRACLPQLDLTKATGQHFAVMVQEPTPANLRAALNTIENTAGIAGAVQLCLLELAVDFYPRDHADPVEALVTREKIVGLVQRHLWGAGEAFLAHEPTVPRRVDPRQVYSDGDKKSLRYLLTDAGDKLHSDTQLQEPSVRRRLLSTKRRNDLYLNSTIYRGEESGPRRTNVQHKIADYRNTAKGTRKILANEERRARVELTLTSLEALEQAGLNTVDDLARSSFRSMSRNLLSFRLPTCEAEGAAIVDAIAQMKTCGVHGVEMSLRAGAQAQREQMRRKPRKTDRDGWALMDWPEMSSLVGAALDRLQKSWRRF
ncbi:hypothetical protein [Puniceibacterium confluentis]|uniref:hypothetical protein n=1 Tax=Puniceibacterium confluentis TaxID=1958944 RepID=UPI0011B4EF22|nr:hypothetical protein [Puniceibacterium confluentis]